MARLNFTCENCHKEFPVRFLLFRPQEVRCPSCGSEKVAESKGSCSCGSSSKEEQGFRFT